MTSVLEVVDLLLVEDDPGDVHLTREAFAAARVNNPLHVLPDGESALAFLRREGRYAASPRPGLVLVDLYLPRLDGRTLIAHLRTDPELFDIPVAVLTASAGDEAIARRQGVGANVFVRKPVDVEQLMHAVKAVEHLCVAVVAGTG